MLLRLTESLIHLKKMGMTLSSQSEIIGAAKAAMYHYYEHENRHHADRGVTIVDHKGLQVEYVDRYESDFNPFPWNPGGTVLVAEKKTRAIPTRIGMPYSELCSLVWDALKDIPTHKPSEE